MPDLVPEDVTPEQARVLGDAQLSNAKLGRWWGVPDRDDDPPHDDGLGDEDEAAIDRAELARDAHDDDEWDSKMDEVVTRWT